MENLDSAPQETHSSKRLLIVLGLLVGTGLAAFYLLGGSQLMQGLLTPRPMTDAEVDREMSNVEGYVTVLDGADCAGTGDCVWPLKEGDETAFEVSKDVSDEGVVFSSEDGAGDWIMIGAKLALEVDSTDGLTVIIQDSSEIWPLDHAMAGATIDWGDSTSTSTEIPLEVEDRIEHPYSSPGDYDITYTITDMEERTDTFKTTVTVDGTDTDEPEPALTVSCSASISGASSVVGVRHDAAVAHIFDPAADPSTASPYSVVIEVDNERQPSGDPLSASPSSYTFPVPTTAGEHEVDVYIVDKYDVTKGSANCSLTVESAPEPDPAPDSDFTDATCTAAINAETNMVDVILSHTRTNMSGIKVITTLTVGSDDFSAGSEQPLHATELPYSYARPDIGDPNAVSVKIENPSTSTVFRNAIACVMPTPESEPAIPDFGSLSCTARSDGDNLSVILDHEISDENTENYQISYAIDETDYFTNEPFPGDSVETNYSLDPALESGNYMLSVSVGNSAGEEVATTSCNFEVAAPEPAPETDPYISASSCDTSIRDHVIITLDHSILPVDEKYVLAIFTKGSSDRPIEMASKALQGSGRQYDYTLESPTGSYTAEIVVKNRTEEIGRTEITCTFPETSASTSTLRASVLLALASGGEFSTETEPIRNIIFAHAGSTVYFKAADEGSEGKNVQILVPGTDPEKMATLSITGEMPADSPTPIDLPRRGSADPAIRPVSPTDADPADTDSPPEVLIEPVDSPPSLDIDEVPPVTADRPTPADPAPAGGGSGTPRPICSDGRDNDGDGRTDFPDDIGCDTPDDTDEYNRLSRTYAACEDGRDNDGDGRVDFPDDLGCDSYEDIDEENTAQEKVITGGTLLNDLCHDKTDPVKFDDLKKSWYAYDVVESEASVEYDGVDKELRGEAIFVGYKDEKDEDERVFLKDRAINRVEAQKIVQVAVCLSDYLEEDEIDLDDLDNDFDDVPKDAWFTHFVNIGVEAGIIDDDKDEYHPYQDVTRAEFMALLVRAYAIITDTDILDFDDDLPFIDVDEDDWFADITYSAYKWGFSEGFTDSNGKQRLSPNRALTRGDAAVWLHNFFAILHDKELGDL